MKTIKFQSPMEAARAVAGLNDGFTPRPSNYHRAAQAQLWWVVPSTKIPAFKYGKFMFSDSGRVLNCGLYVEKGFGQLAVHSGAKQSELMGKDWLWHEFMVELEKGSVSQALTAIVNGLNEPVSVHVSAHYCGGRTSADVLEFSYDGSTLTLKDYSMNQDLLNDIRLVSQLEVLPQALAKLDNQDWFWINIMLYAAFTKDPTSEFGELELCKHVLRYLEAWVR